MRKVLRGTPEYYRLKSAEYGGPLYLMVNLATSCSYRCAKCIFESGGDELSVPGPAVSMGEWRRIISISAQAGVRAVVVAGLGEPTENFRLVSEVVRTACQNELDTVLFSTLAGLDAEQAKFFAENRVTLITSLDSTQEGTYRRLTGGGDMEKALGNLELLRRIYPVDDSTGNKVVRLGINTTVVTANIDELNSIRAFAGDDILFVANAPMHHGRFAKGGAWEQLVGSSSHDFERLAKAARSSSETGSHASIIEGLCGWFSRGVSVDYDGSLISCGYASETRGVKSSSHIKSAKDFLARYEDVRSRFFRFGESVGRTPSCPLRDSEYQQFVELQKGD